GVVRLLESTHAIITVTISMDGLEEDHDRVRGRKGFFKLAMKTIEGLKEIQKKYDKLEIVLRHTMLPDNYKDMPKLYALSKELGIGFTTKPATSGGLFDNDEEFRMWHDNFSQKQKKEAIQILEDIIEDKMKNLDLEKNNLFANIKEVAGVLFLKYSIKFINNPMKNVFPCYAYFSSVLLDNEGNVKTCPVLYADLGNVREKPFNEIWLNKESKRIRKFIKKGKCACFTNCNQIPSLVMSELPKILTIIAKKKVKRKQRLI
ncbi:MAG: SPASM domain-containing protein, partial [Candidatus Aenigmatarchaeota archaeon]